MILIPVGSFGVTGALRWTVQSVFHAHTLNHSFINPSLWPYTPPIERLL